MVSSLLKLRFPLVMAIRITSKVKKNILEINFIHNFSVTEEKRRRIRYNIILLINGQFPFAEEVSQRLIS